MSRADLIALVAGMIYAGAYSESTTIAEAVEQARRLVGLSLTIGEEVKS